MFGLALRVVLIVGSLVTLAFMLLRIRTAKIQIADSISWIIMSLLLLLLSIFPGIATFFSNLLGIQSPINFVYLAIIFILLIKLFSSTLRISRLDVRVQQLAQRLALYEKRGEGEKEKTPPESGEK